MSENTQVDQRIKNGFDLLKDNSLIHLIFEQWLDLDIDWTKSKEDKSLTALCPFCDDAQDSIDNVCHFKYDYEKYIFYCFKCHTSGDIVSYIARTQNISQYKALNEVLKIVKKIYEMHLNVYTRSINEVEEFIKEHK